MYYIFCVNTKEEKRGSHIFTRTSHTAAVLFLGCVLSFRRQSTCKIATVGVYGQFFFKCSGKKQISKTVTP